MNNFYLTTNKFRVTDEKKLQDLVDNLEFENVGKFELKVDKTGDGNFYSIVSTKEIRGMKLDEEDHEEWEDCLEDEDMFYEELSQIVHVDDIIQVKQVGFDTEIENIYAVLVLITHNDVRVYSFDELSDEHVKKFNNPVMVI